MRVSVLFYRQLCCAALLALGVQVGLAQGQPPGPPPGMPPSPPIGPTSFEPNVDRRGGDFSSFVMPDPNVQLCRSTCDSNGKCAAYTYVNPGVQGPNAVCYLKSVVPPPIPDGCCTSGAR
jgi:hypothetical protein